MKLRVQLASVLALSVLWIVLAIPSAWGQASSLRQSPDIQKLIKDSPLAQRIIGQLSDEDLQALAAGAHPATIKPLVDASGDLLNSQQVFTPLTPCRVIDTRIPVPIPFAAGEQRNYDLIGPTDYSSIGGNPAGCGIPGVFNFIGLSSWNIPRALVLNIVAVGANGPGDFRAFPPDEPVPLASVINYANLSSVGLNVANGVVLKTCSLQCNEFFTCGEPCPLGDLAFLADVSGTHLVVDVVGYFSSPETLLTESKQNTGVTLGVPCQEILSCAVINQSTSARKVLVMGSATFEIQKDPTAVDRTILAVSTQSAICPTNAEPGSGIFEISDLLPTDSYKQTVTTMTTFSVPANSIKSFFLNAQVLNGVSTPHSVLASNLVCLFP
jgi:hypothetical protein